MVNETQSQVAVGFNEVLEDEDMIQQHEMELVKEMEGKSDKVWDKGVKDGIVENEKVMPPFGSLSSLSGQVKEETDFSDEDETEEEKSEAQRKKDDLAKKRELRKLKQELKQNDLKLKESTSWSFSPIIPVYNQGEITKYICTISSFDLPSEC